MTKFKPLTNSLEDIENYIRKYPTLHSLSTMYTLGYGSIDDALTELNYYAAIADNQETLDLFKAAASELVRLKQLTGRDLRKAVGAIFGRGNLTENEIDNYLEKIYSILAKTSDIGSTGNLT